MTAPEFDAAVERAARAKYERYDSHYSMPGGLSWEQYVTDDPSAADALYRADARADLTAAGLPELLAKNERLREYIDGWKRENEMIAGQRDEARDVLAVEGERIAQAIEALSEQWGLSRHHENAIAAAARIARTAAVGTLPATATEGE